MEENENVVTEATPEQENQGQAIHNVGVDTVNLVNEDASSFISSADFANIPERNRELVMEENRWIERARRDRERLSLSREDIIDNSPRGQVRPISVEGERPTSEADNDAIDSFIEEKPEPVKKVRKVKKVVPKKETGKPEILKTGLDAIFNKGTKIVGRKRVFMSDSEYLIPKDEENQLIEIVPILKIAERVFSEMYLDFDIIVKKTTKIINFIFHFPNVEIQNSVGDTHPITNLYVTAEFKWSLDGSFKFIGFYGQRTSFSIREWESKYVHSHLESNLKSRQSFCTGSNTPLDKMRREKLSIETLKKEMFAEDYFFTLINNIEMYIKWESLEGGPHCYLEGIGNNSGSLGDIIANFSTNSISVSAYMFNILNNNPSLIKFTKRLSIFSFNIDY